jgi:hypothetical protein
VIAAFTVSCGSATDVQDHSEVGSYGLVTVNGQTLPVTITGTSAGTVVAQGGDLELSPTTIGSYTATVTGTVNGSASVPFLSDVGTYTRSGSTLTFHSSVAPISYSGTFNAGRITVSLPGAVLGLSGNVVLGLEPLII